MQPDRIADTDEVDMLNVNKVTFTLMTAEMRVKLMDNFRTLFKSYQLIFLGGIGFNFFMCLPFSVRLSCSPSLAQRRVEETRRVRFAEEVISIPAVELDLDGADSEEDSGTEEESVLEEEEAEMEQTAMEEEVAPAPRPTLPAWILALKRRKTGRKLRH